MTNNTNGDEIAIKWVIAQLRDLAQEANATAQHLAPYATPTV